MNDKKYIVTCEGKEVEVTEAVYKVSHTSAESEERVKRRKKTGRIIVCNLTAYGYIYKNRKYIVNPPEAEIVRKIFDLYLSGYGRLAISEMLTEETGDKWNAGKIRYILKNEKYIGDSLFQKTYTTEMLPFKGKRNNGELPKYYVEGTQEPIIDKETFHAVQELMLRREGNKWQRQTHIFTKMIVCGNCGHTFKRKIVNGRADTLPSLRNPKRL